MKISPRSEGRPLIFPRKMDSGGRLTIPYEVRMAYNMNYRDSFDITLFPDGTMWLSREKDKAPYWSPEAVTMLVKLRNTIRYDVHLATADSVLFSISDTADENKQAPLTNSLRTLVLETGPRLFDLPTKTFAVPKDGWPVIASIPFYSERKKRYSLLITLNEEMPAIDQNGDFYALAKYTAELLIGKL
ncbi:MAG: hypothetical protein ACK5LX_14405 [Oscillospiraceae bacterium]